MKVREIDSSTRIAILGDIVVYLVTTLVGFSSHGTLRAESLPRVLLTFIPFTAAWFILAPWFGVFRSEILCTRKGLLRVTLASVLAAPIGAFLRGLWLASPILPAFVLIMAGVSAAFMIVWRLVLPVIIGRQL